jgi:hypothetical protein
VVITAADTFTARRRTSGSSVRNRADDTSTTAAAPSPVGQHIGRVLGYAIISAPMISSRL